MCCFLSFFVSIFLLWRRCLQIRSLCCQRWPCVQMDTIPNLSLLSPFCGYSFAVAWDSWIFPLRGRWMRILTGVRHGLAHPPFSDFDEIRSLSVVVVLTHRAES